MTRSRRRASKPAASLVSACRASATLWPVSLEHGHTHAALARYVDSALVAGVGVTDYAHAGVGRENALELLRGELVAVGDDDHASVLRVADPGTTAVMDRDPGRACRGIDERVQQRPVGDCVGTVAHPFSLAIG